MKAVFLRGKAFCAGRFAAVLFCLLLLFGCAAEVSEYEVLGDIEPSNTPVIEEFDFSTTLRLLYPSSDHIVIALISDFDGKTANCTVVSTIVSNTLKEDDLFEVEFSDNVMPVDGRFYMLFIESDGSKLKALTDGSGLIEVNETDNTLTLATGQSISLSQALSELNKMNSYVSIPSYFYYYKDMESLVSNTTYIFTGTVVNVSQEDEVKFYVREPGLEEINTTGAAAYTIEVGECLKGELSGTVSLILSSDMFANTLTDSTLESPTYTEDNVVPLFEMSSYLFFATDSPAGRHGSYMLFVNPFQGYVPLYGDELIPIPINPPFSYRMTLEDVAQEISDILENAYFATLS